MATPIKSDSPQFAVVTPSHFAPASCPITQQCCGIFHGRPLNVKSNQLFCGDLPLPTKPFTGRWKDETSFAVHGNVINVYRQQGDLVLWTELTLDAGCTVAAAVERQLPLSLEHGMDFVNQTFTHLPGVELALYTNFDTGCAALYNVVTKSEARRDSLGLKAGAFMCAIHGSSVDNLTVSYVDVQADNTLRLTQHSAFDGEPARTTCLNLGLDHAWLKSVTPVGQRLFICITHTNSEHPGRDARNLNHVLGVMVNSSGALLSFGPIMHPDFAMELCPTLFRGTKDFVECLDNTHGTCFRVSVPDSPPAAPQPASPLVPVPAPFDSAEDDDGGETDVDEVVDDIKEEVPMGGMKHEVPVGAIPRAATGKATLKRMRPSSSLF